MKNGNLYIITNSYPEKKYAFSTEEMEFVLKHYDNVCVLSFSNYKPNMTNDRVRYINIIDGIREFFLPRNIKRKNMVKILFLHVLKCRKISELMRNIYSYFLALSIIRANTLSNRDLLFSYWLSRPTKVAFFLNKLIGSRYICQGHGSDIYIYPPENIEEILNTAIEVITIGSKNKEHLIKKYNINDKKIHVYRLGVSQNFEKYISSKKIKEKDNRKITFLTVARYHDVKGIDLLLEAIYLIKNDKKINTQIFFEIYGYGNKEKEYRQYIDEMKISDYVKLNGWIDKENLAIKLNTSDAFILPSRSEGLPVVLMEAAAAGLPIISTKVGSISDIAIDGYNAILTSEITSNGIYEAIKRYLCLEEKEKLIYGKNSRILFENYFILEKNLKDKYDFIMSYV